MGYLKVSGSMGRLFILDGLAVAVDSVSLGRRFVVSSRGDGRLFI